MSDRGSVRKREWQRIDLYSTRWQIRKSRSVLFSIVLRGGCNLEAILLRASWLLSSELEYHFRPKFEAP
jgi:hypothetical protein